MDKLLDVDLNKFVSKQITKEINSLKKELTNIKIKNTEKNYQITILEQQVNN